MSTVYIGLHQLIALSVSPAISRLRPGLYFRFALPFRLVEEMTTNLISLVSVLSTPTRGLGAVLAAHAGSYSHVRFVRRGDLRRQLHVDSRRSIACGECCAPECAKTLSGTVAPGAHSFRTGIERGMRASGSTPALRCVLCRVKLAVQS